MVFPSFFSCLLWIGLTTGILSSAEAKQNFPGTNIFCHLFRDTQNNKHIVILEDTEDTGSEDQQQNIDDEDEEDEVTLKNN